MFAALARAIRNSVAAAAARIEKATDSGVALLKAVGAIVAAVGSCSSVVAVAVIVGGDDERVASLLL